MSACNAAKSKLSRAGSCAHWIERLNRKVDAVIDKEIERLDVWGEKGCTVTGNSFEVVHAGVLVAEGGRG
jgi:hypothetical protein